MYKNTLTVAIAAAMFATTGAALAAPTSPDGGVTVAPGVTVRAAPFHVKGTIPAVCFKADAELLVGDAELSPEAGALALSILDAALAFAVADFDAVGILASERHGSSQGQGATTKLVFGAALTNASLSIAATTTNAGALAYADALAAATAGAVATQFTGTVLVSLIPYRTATGILLPPVISTATSGAFASAGAWGEAGASASSLAAAGNLAVGANLSYAEGANLSKGLFGVGFASKGFTFGASASEASASTDALAFVVTTAFAQAGSSIDPLEMNSNEFEAAAEAAAKALAKAVTTTEVKAALGGIFVRVPGKPDVFEAGGVATLTLDCGAGVELEVEATVQ